MFVDTVRGVCRGDGRVGRAVAAVWLAVAATVATCHRGRLRVSRGGVLRSSGWGWGLLGGGGAGAGAFTAVWLL